VIIIGLFVRSRKDPGYEDHRITFRLWHETEIFASPTIGLILNCVEALPDTDVALWVGSALSAELTTTQAPPPGMGTCTYPP